MKIKNYIKKLKSFSLSEKWSIIQYSFGSILSEKITKGLRHSYHFTQKLTEQGIVVKKIGSAIQFNFPIDKKVFDFHLKRSSSDTMVFEQVIRNKEYKAVIDLANSKNIELKNIIDAGANIGLTTLYLKSKYPKAKVILLEPENSIFERMKTNLEINQLTDVIPIQCGLWYEETTLQIDRSFRDNEDWSVKLTKHSEGNVANIKCKTLSQIKKEFEIDVIDFLKIDIEGAEKEVFLMDEGIKTWLPSIKIVALEIHDETNARHEIETVMKNSGFSIFNSGELTIGWNTFYDENYEENT